MQSSAAPRWGSTDVHERVVGLPQPQTEEESKGGGGVHQLQLSFRPPSYTLFVLYSCPRSDKGAS